MSERYAICDAKGNLLCSILTGRLMLLSKSLAEETRADLDFEDRANSPHRVVHLDE
jgi:hypothetical protein